MIKRKKELINLTKAIPRGRTPYLRTKRFIINKKYLFL